MVTLSRFSLKNKFHLIVAFAAAGFVTMGVTTYRAVRSAQMNAPGMVPLVDSKDLLAEFLAPPGFLLEAYTITLEMAEAPGGEELPALIEVGESLASQYRARTRYWVGRVTDPELRRSLQAAKVAGQRFLSARDQEFIPALQAGDRARAHQVLR